MVQPRRWEAAQIRKSTARSGDATSAAAVVHVGGFLVIRYFEGVFRESPQVVTQLAKLDFLANAGKQLLTDRPEHLHASFTNQLSQGLG